MHTTGGLSTHAIHREKRLSSCWFCLQAETQCIHLLGMFATSALPCPYTVAGLLCTSAAHASILVTACWSGVTTAGGCPISPGRLTGCIVYQSAALQCLHKRRRVASGNPATQVVSSSMLQAGPTHLLSAAYSSLCASSYGSCFWANPHLYTPV
jgi:hypothetical protein